MNTKSVVRRLDNLPAFADQLRRQSYVSRTESTGRPRVAAVMDDFSAQCFGSVCDLYRIQPSRTRLDLELIRPDFLLVESAWSGNSGSWRYLITANSGPRKQLLDLLSACHELGIPTVFWNKEDPPHFDEFIEAARLFDIVLTTDADMIPKYAALAPGAVVEMMRFAAAETIHNPSRVNGYRQGDVCFGGQYFSHKFPERRQQMDILFAAASRHKFSIYSRALDGDPRYQFPSNYERNVAGTLPYLEMVKEYRRHKIFLNVNSVVSSRTMCARRVFELSACKTTVMSVDSAALRSVYSSDDLIFVKNSLEANRELDLFLGDEARRRLLAQRAWRKTMGSHTYGHRLIQIQTLISGKKQLPRRRVAIVVVGELTTERLRKVRSALEDQIAVGSEAAEIEVCWRDDMQWWRASCTGLDRTSRVTCAPWDQDYSGWYVGAISSEIAIGPYYVDDLIKAISQQGARFAAKTVADSWRTCGAVEECYRSELPRWGWLAAQTEWRAAINAIRKFYSDLLWPTLAAADVYWSDPLEIASPGRNDSVVEDLKRAGAPR